MNTQAVKNLREMSDAELVAEHKRLTAMQRSIASVLKDKEERFRDIKREAGLRESRSGSTYKELVAGNIGDINSLIWPFIFTTQIGNIDIPYVLAGETKQANITITQEAPFNWIYYTKTVFKITDAEDPAATYTYIDPSNSANPICPGLKFTIRDSQSGQQFTDQPIPLDRIGQCKDPSILPSPKMLLNNSNTEIVIYNTSASDDYAVFI